MPGTKSHAPNPTHQIPGTKSQALNQRAYRFRKARRKAIYYSGDDEAKAASVGHTP
jgi:hypothetical protein